MTSDQIKPTYMYLSPLGEVYFDDEPPRIGGDLHWDGVIWSDDITSTFPLRPSKVLKKQVLPYRPNPIVPKWLDTELAWLIGQFLVAGQASHKPFFTKRPWTLTIDLMTTLDVVRARMVLERMGCDENQYLITQTKITCFNKDIVRLFIKWFYTKDGIKIVPRSLLNTTEEIATAVLESIPSSKITAVSPAMLCGIIYMLKRVAKVDDFTVNMATVVWQAKQANCIDVSIRE